MTDVTGDVTTSTIDLSRYDYVDTAIGGEDHRNHPMRVDQFQPSVKARGVYRTYLRYDDGLVAHWEIHRNANGNPTVSGYRGPCTSLILPFDVDRGDLAEALDVTRLLVDWLGNQWDIPEESLRLTFSGGKGFHVEVWASLFGGFEPSPDMPGRLHRLAIALVDGFELTVDEGVYDPLRLWRVPNTIHEKTERFAIPLTTDELRTHDLATILEWSKAPRYLARLLSDEWTPRPELVELWQSICTPITSNGKVLEWTKTAEPLPEHVKYGRQHYALVSLAGTLRRRGLNYEALAEQLLTFNRTSLERPGPEANIRAIAKSVAAYSIDDVPRDSMLWAILGAEDSDGEQSEPSSEQLRGPAFVSAAWEVPTPFPVASVEPFPVDALPTALRTYVVAVATETQTPIDLAALLGLAVVAVCVQKKVVVQVRRGWIEPTNIYVVVVLPSGNRNSAVVRAVGLPIVEHERNEAERLREEYARATASFKVAEGRAESLRSQAAKAQAADPTSDDARNLLGAAREAAAEVAKMRVPELPRLLVGDATSEAIAKLLAAHGGRIGSLAAEGTLFEVMRGRYSERPNFDVFLNAHAGDDLRVDRIGRPPEIVPLPCLTLGLAVQPDVIRGLVDEKSFRGRGLLARFLYAWPESTVGYRAIEPPAVESEALHAYYDLGAKLLATDYAQTVPGGQSLSQILTFSAEGYAIFRDFLAWIEPQLAETGDLSALADWASKLAGLVARIAGLFHLLEHASDGQAYTRPIASSTIGNAIAVGRYAISHARRTFAEMGANEKIEDAKYLLGLIAKAGLTTFTKRDLHRLAQSRFSTVDLIDGGLALLESHGFVRPLPTDDRAGAGRKPSPRYELNPLIRLDSVNSVNSVTRDLEPKNDNLPISSSVKGGLPPDKIDTIDRINGLASDISEEVYEWSS